MRFTSGRLGRAAIAATCVVAVTLTGVGTRVGAALPDPAPALTPAQLDALSNVAGWDFDYSATHRITQSSSGSGDFVSFGGTEFTSWSTLNTFNWTDKASGTFAGPAGCTYNVTPGTSHLPCTVDYTQPGNYSPSIDISRTNHFSTPSGCGPLQLDPNPNGINSSTITGAGSYRPDGTDGKSAYPPGFAIDISSNPPRAVAALFYDSVLATRIDSGGSCGTSSSTTNHIYIGDAVSFTFGDPAVLGDSGDTQVRVDAAGEFVISGSNHATQTSSFCGLPAAPPPGPLPPCVGTQSESTDVTWTLHPHAKHALKVASVKVEQQSFPNGDWAAVPAKGAIDGNQLRLTVSVTNDDPVDHDVRIAFTDTERGGIEVPQLTGPASTTVPAGGSADLVYTWDTSRLAWDADSSVLDALHQLQLALQTGADFGTVADTAFQNVNIAPRPIVFVHGLVSNAATWDTLRAHIAAAYPAWQTFAVDTMNTGGGNPLAATNTIVQNAQRLDAFIRFVRTQTQAQHVDIVAHSMGGLISRQYIQDLMPNDALDAKPVVTHLVMLGTPNEGSPCATILPFPFPAMFQNTPASVVMFDGQVTNRRGVAFSVLAGTPFPFTCFPTSTQPGDGVVEFTSAFYVYTDTKLELLLTHLGMTSSADEFESFVKPHLIASPGAAAAVSRSAPVSTPARAQAAAADAPQIVAVQHVTVPAAGSADIPIPISHPDQFGVLFVAPGSVSAQLIDPSGNVVASSPEVTTGDTPPFRALEPIAAPAAGTWNLHLVQSGPDPAPAVASAWELGDPLSLQLQTPQADSAHRVHIVAQLTNGGAPVTGATATANLRGVNGEEKTLNLIDRAGNGTYEATSNSLVPDAYQVLVEAHGNGFSRTVPGFVDDSSVAADTSPPETTATPSPASNADGTNNTDVTVTLAATDPDGTADVHEIDYSAIGAQPIAAVTVVGATTTLTFSTQGTTTLSYYARDEAGNTESAHTLIIRIDKTPPTTTTSSTSSTTSTTSTTTTLSTSSTTSTTIRALGSTTTVSTTEPSTRATTSTTTGHVTIQGTGTNNGPLPFTGTDSRALAAFALSCLAGGVLLAHRRRRAPR